MFPESLDTARLLLRKPRLTDAADIFEAYAQDPLVTRYLIWSPHVSIATTEGFLESAIDNWKRGTAYPYVITAKPAGELLGMIEIRPRDTRADLGYVLARRFWSRGYATEAISALVQAALSMPNLYRVEATCDVENIASARALEKAGLTREGLLRRHIVHPAISREPRDSYLYAIVR